MTLTVKIGWHHEHIRPGMANAPRGCALGEKADACEGRLSDAVLACVVGGSNAIGAFYNFIEDKNVQLIGCEAAGRGVNTAEIRP